MQKQKIFNLSSMPKMVLIITLVVTLGSLFGAVSYLLKMPRADLPIIEPVVEEVVITTDKTEYETGEIVEMKIKNDSDKDLTYVLAIESFENGSWDKIVEDTRCECGFNNCVKSELFVEANSERKYPWNQEWGLCDELPLGQKLRVEMIYGERRKPGEGRKGDSKIIYSNEFTIKEKSAVDARCGEKVKFDSPCHLSRIINGYEFDVTLNKCKEVEVYGGCDFESPFESLKECQEVCEKKTDTSDWQTYRNEEFGFEVKYNKDTENILKNKISYYDVKENMIAKVEFSFKDYKNSYFSSVNIFTKSWFYEDTEIRETYNSKTQKKSKIVWEKNQKDGYPLGEYLGENDSYVFVYGIGPNGCPAPEPFCSLSVSIRKAIHDSFSVLENK